MIKSDEGFLLSKFKYNENSIIADFLYKNKWKDIWNNFWWDFKKD